MDKYSKVVSISIDIKKFKSKIYQSGEERQISVFGSKSNWYRSIF